MDRSTGRRVTAATLGLLVALGIAWVLAGERARAPEPPHGAGTPPGGGAPVSAAPAVGRSPEGGAVVAATAVRHGVTVHERREAAGADALPRRAPRLGAARRLTVQAHATVAGWSPAGHLLATRENLADLFLVREDGTLVPIARGPLAGYKPEFMPDGTTVLTRCNDPECGERDRVGSPYLEDHWHAHSLTGEAIDATAVAAAREEAGYVFQRDDQIFFAQGGAVRQLTTGGDRFFAPVLSPDRTQVAYEGLTRGIFLAEVASGERVALGPGNNPSWSPRGDAVLFDRTADDGHAVTRGDLAWAAHRPERPEPPTSLTDGAGVRQRPAWSPDGTQIAYEEDGDVFVAPVEP
ncbi:MAG: PD40 domain-containing protein [Planctomycetes bacterium]|nr:PD40 domain-containing protein [Planctomycetota bacterium]